VSTWQPRGLRPVIAIEPLDQDRQQLLDMVAKLDRRARVLAAVVRILLALLRASGFSLAGQRLPDGAAKAGILRAIASADPFLPLALSLRIAHFEPARYHDFSIISARSLLRTRKCGMSPYAAGLFPGRLSDQLQIGPRALQAVVAGHASVIPTRRAGREREQCRHCHNVPHGITLSASPDIVKAAGAQSRCAEAFRQDEDSASDARLRCQPMTTNIGDICEVSPDSTARYLGQDPGDLSTIEDSP
jgi:hypothetical protein